MYFSRIRLISEHINRKSKINIISKCIYNEHRMMWDFFPEEKEAQRDFLYRRYDYGRLPQYFILSKREPVNDQGIWEIDTKPYEPVIKDGDVFSFSVRVNPVVTKKPEGAGSNKRKREDVYMDALARYKESSQHEMLTNNEIMMKSGYDWLVDRAEKNGFTINENEVLVEGYHRLEGFKDKNNNRIQLGVMDYSGFLKVDQRDLFLNTLFNGLGKAKAFGCGLMLLKPV